MNTEYNLDYLVAVDDQIKVNQDLLSDFIWDNEVIDSKTDVFLSALNREIERLKELQEDGVVYEPLFWWVQLMTDTIGTSREDVEQLCKKFMSQVGDDVQVMYDHEALFKVGSVTLLALLTRVELAEAELEELYDDHRHERYTMALLLERMEEERNALQAQ